MNWGEWFGYGMLDEVVEVSEEDALRYRDYYDETMIYAIGCKKWTLEEHQQYPMYAEPIYEDLPQYSDISWEVALSIAYGWAEQNEYLQGDDFLRYVVSTQFIAFSGSPLRAWRLEFCVKHGDNDERYVSIPAITVDIDARTGYIKTSGGKENFRRWGHQASF